MYYVLCNKNCNLSVFAESTWSWLNLDKTSSSYNGSDNDSHANTLRVE